MAITVINNQFTTNYNSNYNDLQSNYIPITLISMAFTMAITIIYNRITTNYNDNYNGLQSIGTQLQPITMAITMI